MKHDFRQVLPSENHRRKSMDYHRDLMVSANDETSSVSKFFKHFTQPPSRHDGVEHCANTTQLLILLHARVTTPNGTSFVKNCFWNFLRRVLS